jgi:energy-converting hydrogenase Eha subunit E
MSSGPLRKLHFRPLHGNGAVLHCEKRRSLFEKALRGIGNLAPVTFNDERKRISDPIARSKRINTHTTVVGFFEILFAMNKERLLIIFYAVIQLLIFIRVILLIIKNNSSFLGYA